jgi:hypothetical protein
MLGEKSTLLLRSDRSRPSRGRAEGATAMGRFQLVFRREGKPDRTEYRYNDGDGEPRINGRLIVHGELYTIYGVEWLIEREDPGDFVLHRDDDGHLHRFICTLVVEPTDD